MFMRYIKFYEEIDNKMWKNNFDNIAKIDKESFFVKYPKKDTVIHFRDKQATYDLYLHDVNINNLIFKTESGKYVVIENPYNITQQDLEKISLLPVKITDQSKELVTQMLLTLPK